MPHITHQIAQITIDFSNSMIESVIKQLKYRYLKTDEFESIEQLTDFVYEAIIIYNNRPRKIHLGKTPLQILNEDEQCKTELKTLMEQLREKRIEENKEFKCLKVMYI